MRKRALQPLERNDPRCKNMTAAAYCRKSTATEGRSKSLEEQLELCLGDAKKFGFGNVLEFVEKEGKKGHWYWQDDEHFYEGPYRDELTQLVRGIKSGQIQAVIIYKLNRLARDNGIEDAFAKICQKYKVHWIINGRDIEIDTARGKCLTASEAARAAEFKTQIGEDIKRDHDWKFERCFFTHNPSCLGFRSAGHQKIAYMYEELEIVKKIFAWYNGLGGEVPMGEYQIAQRCMREGIVLSRGTRNHPVRDQKKVTVCQIMCILRNPMYVGEWQHNRETKPYPQLLIPPQDGIGEPKPLISQGIWNLTTWRKSTKTKIGSRAATSKRLLTGLVVCASCGLPCHVTRIKGTDGIIQERWFCGRRFGLQRSCFGESYTTCLVPMLDEWVKDYICPMISLELKEVQEERKLAPGRLKFEALQNEVVELKRVEMERLTFAIKKLDDATFENLANALREERESKEREVAEYQRIFGDSNSSQDYNTEMDLQSLDPSVLRTAIHRSLRWITITKNGVIAYNKIGGYYAGGFEERDKTQRQVKGSSRELRPPNYDDVVQVIDWLSDQKTFAEGRRRALKDKSNRLTVEEIGA
jgi:hypothetical protein